jgi:uncharacterized damage-inducible protein DinB
MITTANLAEAFARNVTIIQRQAAGLTQEESLRQPPFRGNCLNWVVGHLADYRDHILRALDAEPVIGEAGERYARESEPISGDGPGVLPLEALLAMLAKSQEGIAEALGRATPEDLAREVPAGQRTVTVGERLFFWYFHETYHVGQTELLRQLAGKNDKII